MSIPLAKVLVMFEAETAKFNASLEKMSARIDRFGASNKSALGKVGQDFKRLALHAVGITAIFSGLHKVVSTVFEGVRFGDELAKGAQKSGIAAQAFTELAHAAKMSDVDLGQLSIGLKKMQVALSKAGSGGEESRKTLAALGLTFQELKSLSPDRQFELIGDRISQLQDPADRTRAAVELFGKSGSDLLPLFEKGAMGIRAAREEAKALGVSLSAIDLAKIQEADLAIKRLTAAFSGLKMSLVTNLAEPIAIVIDRFLLLFGGLKSDPLQAEIDAAGLEVRKLSNGVLDSINNWLRWGRITGTTSKEGIAAIARLDEAQRKFSENEAIRRANIVRPAPRGSGLNMSPGFGDKENEELAKARAEIAGLSAPLDKLRAQFEAQKAKLLELAATYPSLAGAAHAAIANITADFFDATDEVRKFEDALTSIKVDASGFVLDAKAPSDLKLQIDHITEALDNYSAAARLSTDITKEQAEAYRILAASIPAPTDQIALLNEALGTGEMADLDRQINEAMTAGSQKALGKINSNMDSMKDKFKETTDAMSVFADQAARGIQDTLADFLFDPFDKGLKKMLAGFIDVLRRMVAEAAAAQILQGLGGFLGGLFGGAAGGGGGGGGLGGLPAAATGGLVTVSRMARGGLVKDPNPRIYDHAKVSIPKMPRFASGDLVKGPALSIPGVDKVPALMQPGEFVVRKDRVSQPGGLELLRAINAGLFTAKDALDSKGAMPKIQKFAGGGLVGGPSLFAPGAALANENPAGGLTVNYYNDNRGASVELIRALPDMFAENNRRLMETMRDARTRGAD